MGTPITKEMIDIHARFDVLTKQYEVLTRQYEQLIAILAPAQKQILTNKEAMAKYGITNKSYWRDFVKMHHIPYMQKVKNGRVLFMASELPIIRKHF